MFLVEKSHLTSHFRSVAKKSSPIPKRYQLPARSFDEEVILHVKALTPASNSSTVSLSWLSKAVSFLSMVHAEAQDHISNLRCESDCYQALYMDYSLKVLDLCNLISSAASELTERRLLMNLSLRLVNFSGQIPKPEKLKKAKDALIRSTHHAQGTAKEQGLRAKALIGELAFALDSMPRGKTSSARDLIRRTFYGLGLLTVFVASVLVSVLYRQSDVVDVRVPAEFLWADSVNGVQTQILKLTKPKQVAEGGEEKGWLSEVDDMASQELGLCDALDEIVLDGDGKHRARLENRVEELGKAAKKFSDGVDGLTNGVNGLFSTVLKMRNDVLDSARKGPW